MKLILLVPGTGNFHCGSCMRDHVLAGALRRAGVEALIAPMYLPAVVDEDQSENEREVFFGGVNTYLKHKLAVFRRAPRWMGRWLDAGPLLRASAGLAHMTSARDLGELTIAMLRGEEGTQLGELERLVEWIDRHGLVDAVLLNNLLLIGLARRMRERSGASIICTLHGEEGFIDSLPQKYRQQAWGLVAERARDVDAFISVSESYARRIGPRLGSAAERVRTVHNGIEVAGYGAADAIIDPPVIGYMARMCACKGLGELVEGFIELRRDERFGSVKLAVAGAMTPGDRRYVRAVRERLQRAGLSEAVRFEANISAERKREFLRGLSVLSVPADGGESFGLYVLEAWASGVPVVQPGHDVFKELLAIGQGGILHEAGDAASLAGAWKQLLADPQAARAMGARGQRAVHERFTSDQMAAGVMQVVRGLAGKER